MMQPVMEPSSVRAVVRLGLLCLILFWAPLAFTVKEIVFA